MEDALIRAAQLGLGSVFVVAGVAKGRVDTRAARRLALTNLVNRMSVSISLRSIARLWRGIGVVEVGTGVGLLVPATLHEAALIARALLAIGLGYLIVARKVSPARACGCFGTGGRITARTIVRCVYALGWAVFLVVQPAERRSSVGDSESVIIAIAAAMVLPLMVASLTWRDLARMIPQRSSEVGRFARAHVASPKLELQRIQASGAWRAMSSEVGPDLGRLVTLDTWMEGNWRMWELSDSRSAGNMLVIAGRYLGTRSGSTRLMVFEGPVEAGKYIGTWDDSRLVGARVASG